MKTNQDGGGWVMSDSVSKHDGVVMVNKSRRHAKGLVYGLAVLIVFWNGNPVGTTRLL